jgi:hypothetical protein
MGISWDENQLPALSSWIEEKLPLKEGEIAVATMDIPANCFAGSVDLQEKEFVVFANLECPLSDVTVNVFLGYIVALAYDRSGWVGLPPADVLFDCHRQVCQAMLEFNEEFSKALEEHADILEAWHKTHANDVSATTTVDTDDLVDQMSSSLFVVNPDDSKKYGAN